MLGTTVAACAANAVVTTGGAQGTFLLNTGKT